MLKLIALALLLSSPLAHAEGIKLSSLTEVQQECVTEGAPDVKACIKATAPGASCEAGKVWDIHGDCTEFEVADVK